MCRLLGLLTERRLCRVLRWSMAPMLAWPAMAGGEQWQAAQPDAQGAPWPEHIKALILAGRLDDAARQLDQRLAASPQDVEARFLRGMIHVATGNYQPAIRLFRSILADQPSAARVRLELARAFFLDKDYGNARRQFQFALAGNLPPPVIANINAYLAAIRDAKSLSYSLALSVAPDSNINTGSSANEVSLYGIPFDLSDEARKRSGIGLAVEASGEWAPRIGPHRRLRIGFNGQRREYRGSTFDDMVVTAYIGPRITDGDWELSLLGTVSKRWYGSHAYNHSIGGRVEGSYQITPRTALSAAVTAQQLSYRRAADKDGHLFSVFATAYYALTPSSAATFKLGLSRQSANYAAYSNRGGFIAAGYYRDMPWGFSAYVEPSFAMVDYDEILAGFGELRSDRTKSLTLALLNRKLVLSRFTPRVSYVFTDQHSSLSLYRFKRSRLEFGLTTSF